MVQKIGKTICERIARNVRKQVKYNAETLITAEMIDGYLRNEIQSNVKMYSEELAKTQRHRFLNRSEAELNRLIQLEYTYDVNYNE